MRLEKRLFERFLKGVKEWLPSYYDSIVDTATIDDVGYKMGFDKEPAYIFDFELSDEKIKVMLNNQGINIARRTVSKYREELEILPSSKRKTLISK